MRYAPLSLLLVGLAAAPCLAEPTATPSEATGHQATFRRLAEFIGGKTADFKTSLSSRSRTRQVNGSVHFLLQQPNLFRIDAATGRVSYTLVSDGQVMTIYNPRLKKYVELAAPDSAAKGLGLITGLSSIQSQLLRLASVIEDVARGSERFAVTAGESSKVGDHQCKHFTVVEQTDAERYSEQWEVWLRQADEPLLCKFTVKSSDGSSDDVQTNHFTWTSPKFAEGSFVFHPPAGAKKVDSVGDLGFGPAL
jgi:hypothetical protein